MGNRFSNFSKWFVPQRNKAHIAVFILSILMIPGALTALQPIDMESYEMESPELTAQTIINEEFANSEIILGFVISARDPVYVPDLDNWSPVEPMSDGAPDYSSLPGVNEMVESGEPWQGHLSTKGWNFESDCITRNRCEKTNCLRPRTGSGSKAARQ